MAQSVQFADFNDEKHFLTWDHLPAKGHGWRPSGHWAMLAEIIDFDNFLRYRTTVKDENDEELVVAFYLDSNAAFDFSKLKAGHTMVIMYPYQHHFLDGSYGVRIENPDHVRIFPIGLEKLQWLSSDIIEHSVASANGHPKCHGCDKQTGDSGEALLRCAGCKMFAYCSKDCQVKVWKEGNLKHKDTCKVLRDSDFQKLIALDFSTPVNRPFSFSTA